MKRPVCVSGNGRVQLSLLSCLFPLQPGNRGYPLVLPRQIMISLILIKIMIRKDRKPVMTDGIIFDVDGTIWDSTFVSAKAWSKAASAETGSGIIITAEQLKALFGLPMDKILDALFPELSSERKNALAGRIYGSVDEALMAEPPEVYDGLKEALAALAERYPLFVVSNCQKGYIERMYSATDTEKYFRDKLSYGDTGKYKADNIKAMINRYHLQAPVYVGDTQGDLEASKEAGCAFVWASYGFGQVCGYDYIINTPGDLIDLFA